MLSAKFILMTINRQLGRFCCSEIKKKMVRVNLQSVILFSQPAVVVSFTYPVLFEPFMMNISPSSLFIYLMKTFFFREERRTHHHDGEDLHRPLPVCWWEKLPDKSNWTSLNTNLCFNISKLKCQVLIQHVCEWFNTFSWLFKWTDSWTSGLCFYGKLQWETSWLK